MPKYVAPRTVDRFEQVSKALRDIQEALDGLLRGTYVLGLQTTDFSPLCPSFTRVSPPATNLRVVLPLPSPDNAGLPIILNIENPTGTLEVHAALGSTVNGLAVATFTAAGIVVLYSNGVDAWSSASPQTNTPAAPPVDALYHLASSNSILTNARVAFNSPTVSVNYGTAGSVRWDWLGLSASAGTTNGQFTSMRWQDANNVSFGINTNGVITATVTVASTQASIRLSDGVAAQLASAFTFQSATGTESQNVTFGLAGSRFTAGADIGLSAGTTRFSRQLFSFADANNVSWGISTNVGGVARVTASASFPAQTQFVLSNSNGLTWGTAGSTVTGSFSTLSFSNANNVTFGIAGSTLTASATVAATRELGLVSHIGGNSVASVSRIAFSNASNVTWSLSTAANAVTVLASVNAGAGGGIALAIPGSTYTSGTVVLTNDTFVTANFVTSRFGVSNVAFLTEPGGNVIAAAGFQVADNGAGGRFVSKIEFKNSNGITFGEASSTDTGGRIAVITASTAFNNETSITNFALNSISVANVVFTNSVGSLQASALMRFQDGTNSTQTGGFLATKLQFASSNGISFGLATTNDAQGRNVVMTASYAPLAIGAIALAGASPVSAGTVNFTNFNFTADQRGYRKVNVNISNTSSLLFDWEAPEIGAGGIWNEITGGANRAISFNTAIPFFFAPFPSGQMPIWGRGADDHRAADWFVLFSGNSSTTVAGSTFSTASLFITAELGLYSVESSIGSRLVLLNSASRTFSFASSQGSLYHGVRWLEFDQSNWASSTGPLTYGEYFCAIRMLQNNVGNSTATSGRNDIRVSFLGASANGAATGMRGLFGAAVAADSKWAGWAGHFSATTGALPGTVVSSNLVNSIANAAFVPGLSIRANGVSAGWPGP